MIDYERVREIIAKGLKSYVKCPVVKSNQNESPPAYPYISYTITTLASANNGSYGVHDNGVHAKPVKQTWSITAKSDNDSESVMLACKAREWLENVGTTYLTDNNVICESVGGITNRDNILTVAFEYNKGFDAVFNLMDIVGNATEESGEIESYEIGINENKGGV